MRLTVRLLGRELLAVDLDTGNSDEEDEPVLAPPFGFSGSSGGQAELASDWIRPEEGSWSP